MFNSKFIKLLKKLSTRERSRFSKYVHSPFFNRHAKICQLWDHIQEVVPEFDSLQLEKGYVYAMLYPKLPYNDLDEAKYWPGTYLY